MKLTKIQTEIVDQLNSDYDLVVKQLVMYPFKQIYLQPKTEGTTLKPIDISKKSFDSLVEKSVIKESGRKLDDYKLKLYILTDFYNLETQSLQRICDEQFNQQP